MSIFDDLDVAVEAKTEDEARASLRVLMRHQSDSGENMQKAGALGDIFGRMLDLQFTPSRQAAVRALYLRVADVDDFAKFAFDTARAWLRNTKSIG